MLSHKEEAKIELISRTAGAVLRLMFSTCKIDIINRGVHTDYICGEQNAIGATWHRGAIFLIYFFGPYHPTLLLSRSRDGEYLARFAERMGISVVRGSNSSGSVSSLHAMIRTLQDRGGKFATVLDGPRGPRLVAKPGLILLAQKTKVPIIPIAWSATRLFTFRKSWDRTIFPLPFSTIKLAYGDPIIVPAGGGKKQVEAYTSLVQEKLLNLTQLVDHLCGYDGW